MPNDARAPRAEFLLCDTEDRQTLNALFYPLDKPTRSVVIYVPGMTGGFSGIHDYAPLATKLAEIGYALLVPNLRTAGLHGMLYARFDEYRKDIAAMVALVKGRGFDQIALLGTSLGGPRILDYWRHTRDPAVKALGFISSIKSPYLEAQIRFDDAKKADFDAHLAKCRELIKAGRGSEILTYGNWFPGRDMVLAAHVFVDFFGTIEESDASTVKFGSEVTIPTMVVHGAADNLALPPNGQAIYDSLTNAPKRDLIWVEGGTHFLQRGRSAEGFAKAISGWLAANLPAARAG
jgi:pimeloyl-ACP methyl ester carboxylesterase